MVIVGLLQQVLCEYDLLEVLISVIFDLDCVLMQEFMEQVDIIDVIILCGGEGFICYVIDNSKVLVIQYFKGVCYLYVDKDVDFDMVLLFLINGKIQCIGVCNVLEGLVVYQVVVGDFLLWVNKMCQEKGVMVYVNEVVVKYFDNVDVIGDDEFGEEYFGLEIVICVVKDYDEVLLYIYKFGSYYIEVICMQNMDIVKYFQCVVDVFVVMINVFLCFNDGSQFGFGVEIGIVIMKLYVYGFMGLELLIIEKYVVMGIG